MILSILQYFWYVRILRIYHNNREKSFETQFKLTIIISFFISASIREIKTETYKKWIKKHKLKCFLTFKKSFLRE